MSTTRSAPPCSDPWAVVTSSDNWLKLILQHSCSYEVVSSGCRLMASLISHQVCSPAEALHTSQGERSSCALEQVGWGGLLCGV